MVATNKDYGEEERRARLVKTVRAAVAGYKELIAVCRAAFHGIGDDDWDLIEPQLIDELALLSILASPERLT